MSTPTDKEIAWQGRIQERAMHVTKAILDRLDRYPKSGFSTLVPADRRDIAELIAKQVVDTMSALGSYVVAGAQDHQVATLEQVTIKGSDKVKLALVPAITDGKPINLDLLAQNSGKQVVVAFINGVAYQQAREALSKAITREQTDWINREQDRDAADAESQQAAAEGTHPAGEVIEGTATAVVANITARAEGDLIADQPGENDVEAREANTETAAEAGAGEGAGEGSAEPPTGGVGEGAQGPDPDNSVQRSPPARKPRRGRPWAGHH